MDRSQCKRLVEERIESLMEMFGIPHWNIVIEYEPLSTSVPNARCQGYCSRIVSYNRATIKLNFDELQDEEELERVLIHELFHILISPFDLYREVLTQGIENESTEDLKDTRLYIHAMEQAVINLERLYRGVKNHYTKEDIFKHVTRSEADSGKRERAGNADRNRDGAYGLPVSGVSGPSE